MNLQTDNDMKRVLLFFSLMLLLGNIKGLAQSIVIDPVMIGTLVYSHQEQQGVLKDIQSEETKNPQLSNFNPTKNESNSILTGEDIQLSFYS